MCLATEHRFECVGCDRFIKGTVTIAQFCRQQEDVEQDTIGRFVFPGTDDLIVFPKPGQKAEYYEGQEEEQAAADKGLLSFKRTEDSLIPHRYFQIQRDFVRPRFCKSCLRRKFDRDERISKRLNPSLARIYPDDIDTTYALRQKGVQANDIEVKSKATAKTVKHVNIFDNEWCYYLPKGYNSKLFEKKRKGWRDTM